MMTTLDAMKERYDLLMPGAATAQSDKYMGFSCVASVRDGTNVVGLVNPHDTLARFDRAGIIKLHGQAQISAGVA
jgi:hypothetical protein